MNRTDRQSYAEYTQHNMDLIAQSEYRFIQPKYDGLWGRLEIRDGYYTLYSRTNKVKKTGLYKCDKYDIDATFIGEYINNKNHPVHDNQAFYVFDCIRFDGKDITYEKYSERYRFLKHRMNRQLQHTNDVWLRDFVESCPTYDMTYSENTIDDLWSYYVDRMGYEGLVFKNNSEYFDKHANIRVKQRVEIDYMCIGFDMADPESKYAGQVGAVRGSLFDKPCDVKCGGLTEAMRKEYTANPEKYIGQVFTATGNGWFPSGSVRHPKFSLWREDKQLHQCKYNQIPESIRAS